MLTSRETLPGVEQGRWSRLNAVLHQEYQDRDFCADGVGAFIERANEAVGVDVLVMPTRTVSVIVTVTHPYSDSSDGLSDHLRGAADNYFSDEVQVRAEYTDCD